MKFDLKTQIHLETIYLDEDDYDSCACIEQGAGYDPVFVLKGKDGITVIAQRNTYRITLTESDAARIGSILTRIERAGKPRHIGRDLSYGREWKITYNGTGMVGNPGDWRMWTSDETEFSKNIAGNHYLKELGEAILATTRL